MKYNIPFNMSNTRSFIKSEEIDLIINYYRFLNNNNDEIALTNLLHHKRFSFDNSFYLKLKNDKKKYNVNLIEALQFYDEIIPDVKYFFDYYQILSEDIKYLDLIEFYNKLIYVLSLESYYMKQPNGQIHIQR